MLAFFNDQEAKMTSGKESNEEYKERIGRTYMEVSQFRKE